MENRKTEVYDVYYDNDGYLQFQLEVDKTSLEGLYRIYDPLNGNSMELVSIDYGYFHPDVAGEWSLIEDELTKYGLDYYKVFIADMDWQQKLTEAMNLLGYERIELDRDSFSTIGFRNLETDKEVTVSEWDEIYDFIIENIPKNNIKAELIEELVKFDRKIQFYMLELSNNVSEVFHTFYGNLEDIYERYQRFPAGKVIGIHITEGNDEEHIAVGRYSATENKYEVLDERLFKEKIWYRFGSKEELEACYMNLKELGYENKNIPLSKVEEVSEDEILESLKNMTEDEKEAFIGSVEIRRDWSDPVSEYESKLYDAIINERSNKSIEQKEYEIEIIETISRVVKIQSDSEEVARLTVKDMYKNGEIVLNENDFIEVSFEPYNSKKKEIEQEQTKNHDKQSNFRKMNLLGKSR